MADVPDLLTRRAAVSPKSVDAERRSFEVVWSTGAAVRRRGFIGDRFQEFDEELSLEDGHVRLDRLNGGAPFLDTHGNFALVNVIGVVERAWLAGAGRRREGRARIRMSDREAVEPIWGDIRAGIIRNISVGYRVLRFEEIAAKTKDAVPTRRAVDWEPMEISAVPIGADPKAKVREETRMPPIATDDQAAPSPAPAATDPALAERERISGIQSTAHVLRLPAVLAQRMVAQGVALEAAREELLAEAMRRDQAQQVTRPARVEPGDLDTSDARAFAGRASDALAARMGARIELDAEARALAAVSVVDLGRMLLERAGAGDARWMPAGKVLERSFLARGTGALHTTSDFPIVLAEALNKVMLDAYEAAPSGIRMIARSSTARDFRSKHAIRLGEAPDLLPKGEHGEFVRGSMAEAEETYRLSTFGRVFAITREALVNDDLSAFGTFVARFGQSAAELEAEVLVDLLFGPAGVGPTMSEDNTALFHANHNNLAASGAAISVESVGAARTAMRLQVGLSGRPIAVEPKFLLVPAALETVAEQLLATLAPAKMADAVPESLRKLELVVEPRLDSRDDDAWYLAAVPGTPPTLEYSYLEGDAGPRVDVREGFDVDGTEFRCRLDYGAGALDFRGLFKNPGV